MAAYLDAVRVGDRRAAMAIAAACLDRGVPAERVIGDLLARAQAEVGRGWQDARWSIAMEHRATSISEAALQTVMERSGGGWGAAPPETAVRAVVLCAEGEWHSLPARMAADVMRLRGADVWFVGASLPARELAAFLGNDAHTAAAVACSLPLNLVGAWRTVSALREVGATIICGGRGFGPRGRWVQAVGGDLWAPDFTAGADLLLQLVTTGARALPRAPVGDDQVVAEVNRLRRDAGILAEAATALALGDLAHTPDHVLLATREDLRATIQAVASSVVVSDPRLVEEFVGWFESVIAARDLPLTFVSAAFDTLLDVIPADLPRARVAAAAGLRACTQPPR